jgi:hypothetical protein
LSDEASVALFVFVFTVYGWVEGAAHVIYVDLDVSYVLIVSDLRV